MTVALTPHQRRHVTITLVTTGDVVKMLLDIAVRYSGKQVGDEALDCAIDHVKLAVRGARLLELYP